MGKYLLFQTKSVKVITAEKYFGCLHLTWIGRGTAEIL